MSDLPPIGRFSPAPGLYIDRTDRSVRITGMMEMHGPHASAARAAQVQMLINNTWTKTFPDGYAVSCNIVIRYRAPGSSPGNFAQIEVDRITGPSHVNSSTRNMTLNANGADVFTWVAAHEFGHVLGLDDRYTESIFSRVAGEFGGTRTTTVNPGYEGNMMAVHRGTLAGQNVADLASENAPSPYWMNDDDHIRNWVFAHSNADIAVLSTTHKLQAIRILMGGWISDDDIRAMDKICRSVTTTAESTAIQRGINLSDFTSIGQRTQMRVTFSRMPGGWIR